MEDVIVSSHHKGKIVVLLDGFHFHTWLLSAHRENMQPSHIEVCSRILSSACSHLLEMLSCSFLEFLLDLCFKDTHILCLVSLKCGLSSLANPLLYTQGIHKSWGETWLTGHINILDTELLQVWVKPQLNYWFITIWHYSLTKCYAQTIVKYKFYSLWMLLYCTEQCPHIQWWPGGLWFSLLHILLTVSLSDVCFCIMQK